MSQQLAQTKEEAEYTLELVNSWINTIDTKVSYALSLTGILTGFILIQGTPQAFFAWNSAEEVSFSIFVGAILVALLYLSSYSAICLFVFAIMAHITPISDANSHLFFGQISKLTLQQYKHEYADLTEEEYIDELLEQIHVNSGICTRKGVYYQRGIYVLLIAISLCFICCVFQLI